MAKLDKSNPNLWVASCPKCGNYYLYPKEAVTLDFIEADCDVAESHETPLISEFSTEVEESIDEEEEVRKRTRGRSAKRA